MQLVTCRYELSEERETTTKAPLYLAAEKGHAAVIEVLLRHHADVHAHAVTALPRTTSRTSPLWAARRGGHDRAAELLAAAGATELASTTSNEEGVEV